jgi:sugar O-acyltransferase (sialic acid O-acetyltransferase NeuD family)
MKNLAIYGSNGFGHDMFCLLKNYIKNADWHFIGFFDDTKEKGLTIDYGKILGGIDDLNSWPEPLNIILAIGYPKGRLSVYEKITNPHITFPNIITDNIVCYDLDNFIIGKGNIICPNSLIGSNVSIGDFNVLNGINLGHDVKIGSFNTLMPGVHLSGNDHVGNRNMFGLCSIVIEKIKIGNDTTICPMSAIYHKTKDGSMYLGNPAKLI